MNSFVFFLFTGYTHFRFCLYKIQNHLKKYTFINNMTNMYHRITHGLYNTCMRKKVEPIFINEWLSVSYMIHGCLKEQFFNNEFEAITEFSKEHGILITSKRNEQYSFQQMDSLNDVPSYTLNEPVKNPFIIVQYKTKNQLMDITLESSYFIKYNHLFSSLFLMRYFEYHSDYIWDDNYEIYVMDKNMNIHILKQGTFIELIGNEQYKIKTIR